MSAKIFLAIMGLNPDAYDDILLLGGNIYDNLYVTNVAMFVDPPVIKTEFKAQLDASTAAQVKAVESGGKLDIADRNDQLAKLYDMMNVQLKPFVNNLYRGNKVNLMKSGFRVSKEPSPHGIPLAPKCKYAKNGMAANTVKFVLEKLSFPEGQAREKLKFNLYVTEDPNNTDELRLILKGVSSRKLIATGVERGKDYYYYITAQNNAGESELSERVKYMLN